MLILLVPMFKRKGDLLRLNLQRVVKLLQHAFKFYKKVLDGCLRKLVDTDKIQYGFTQGKGTVYPLFSLGRLVEKFRSKNRFCFVFAGLEKAFDYQEKVFVLL